MSVETVSIKIQTGVCGQFRNLNNKVWFALSEYVDNAVQSYENNKVLLKNINNGKYKFEVRINIDREKDQIKIYDNAAGIDTKNFQRAFEPANIPINNRGLHEFGMGMKTASIWLANFWSVRTAAVNEIEERYVEFKLDKVLKENEEVLKVKNTSKDKKKHFTEIILSNLSQNAPSIMQMDKIRRHLSSIYRKFIRNGDLHLYINDILLTYEEPEILKAPYYSDPNGKPVIWKKNIKFKTGKYAVTGFIGILNTMSTSEVNGLSLFRRGRVIEGSHDEKYRPKTICGQIGSPRYKRIFGELELEGFAVSFNKGSFQEQEDLASLMEVLQLEISAKEFDLYTQAEKYIKPKTQDDNVRVAKKIVKNIKKATKVENLNAKVETSLKEIENKSISTKNEQLSKKAKVIESHIDFIEIKDEQIKLKFECIDEPLITDLYTLQMEENDEMFDKTATFKLNLAHKFFTRFEMSKSDDDYQAIFSIIRALVLAELLASSQGAKHAGYVRNNFNNLIQNL
jgi:hypothetical protein